jgi:hypothetical protein
VTDKHTHFLSPSSFADELRRVVEGKVEVSCTVYVNVCGSEWRVRNARRPTNHQKWDFAVWGPGGGAAARSLSSAEEMVRGWARMTADGRASADSSFSSTTASSSFSSTAASSSFSSSFQTTPRHSSASAAEGEGWEERQEEAAMSMQKAWRYAEAVRAAKVTERLRREDNAMAQEEAMQAVAQAEASSDASPSLFVSSRSDLAGRALRGMGWRMGAEMMSPSLPLLRSRRPLPDGPVRMRVGGGKEAVGLPTGSVLSEAHARLLGVSEADKAMSHLLSGTGFAMDVHEVILVAEEAESPSFRHVCSVVGALYLARTEAGDPVSYFRLECMAWEEGGSQHEEERRKREAHDACARICEAGVEGGTLCAVGGYAPWEAGATGADADAMAVQHLILEGIAPRTTSPPRLAGWYKTW